MTVRSKYAYDVETNTIMRRKSMGRLIIDGKRVYELDEACLQQKRRSGKNNAQMQPMKVQENSGKQKENHKRS